MLGNHVYTCPHRCTHKHIAGLQSTNTHMRAHACTQSASILQTHPESGGVLSLFQLKFVSGIFTAPIWAEICKKLFTVCSAKHSWSCSINGILANEPERKTKENVTASSLLTDYSGVLSEKKDIKEDGKSVYELPLGVTGPGKSAGNCHTLGEATLAHTLTQEPCVWTMCWVPKH